MGQAAYNTTIKLAGISTAFDDEPTTNISGFLYQINDANKRVLDHDEEITVEVDDVEADEDDYVIDYLFGIITFSEAPGGAVSISGNYIPLMAVGGAMEYAVNLTGDILDSTGFNEAIANSGYRTKQYGLTDVSASIERFAPASSAFAKGLKERDRLFVEFTPGGEDERIHGWFVVESTNQTGELTALETESIALQLDGQIQTSFSWR